MTKICESVNDDKRPEEKAVPPPPPVHRDEWKVSRNDVTGPGDDGDDWQPVGEGTWGIVQGLALFGVRCIGDNDLNS